MTVRSKQLGINGSIGTGGNNIYTAPTGYRAIVKSIWLESNHSATQRIVVSIWNSGSQIWAAAVTLGASASATESMLLTPWVVLMPGDTLNIKPLLGSCQAVVSGAELLI